MDGRWSIAIAILVSLSGCDFYDRERLDLQVPRRPGGDPGPSEPRPDAGDIFDSGMVGTDSGLVDSGTPDSGAVDSGTVIDGGPMPDATVEAGADAAGDAAPDASCADCEVLRAALRHRYRFDGTGTVVTDTVSGANGNVLNAALDGSSALTLAGGTSEQYVELPDGIISALTDATFEAWVTWQGGASWQRVFDFGDMDGNNGRTYLFITPSHGGGTASLRATMSLSGSATEVLVDGTAALDTGEMRHLAVVVDDQNELRLYLDGALVSSVPNTRALSALSDVNNWLGRSQFAADEELAGTYHEFRIYDEALTGEQIAASFALGPDPAGLE